MLFPRADAGDELSFWDEAGVTWPSSVSGGMLYVVDVDIGYGPRLRGESESELLLQRFYEHRPPRVGLGVAGVLAGCDLRGEFEDEIEVAGEPGLVQHRAVQVANSAHRTCKELHAHIACAGAYEARRDG